MTLISTRRELEAPLEDFHRLHTATLRRFGNRAVDLSFPNPKVLRDTRPHDALMQLAHRTKPDDLRYSPFGGFTAVRRQVAQQLGRQHQLAYEHRDILLTPGATAALTLIIGELLQPPDHAVVISPSWMDYPLYLHRHGVEYAMSPTTPDKRLDLHAIERTWTPRTRALIVSNPASPTGVCFSDSEIRALADLLRMLGTPAGTPPLLINDETHRDQVWAGTMTSAAQHYPHTVTVYSYGKAWQMQGERVGYAAVHPQHPARQQIRKQLVAGMRSTGLCAPAATSQHLVAALADYTPPLGRLGELQRHARHRLRKGAYTVIDAEATPFVYIGAPSGDGIADARYAANHGVLVMPSDLFHEHGYLRLALNTEGAPLDRALDALIEMKRSRGRHA